MPGDYESLKRTIEDGVHAAEELQKLLAEQKREERPKLRLIRGGLVGGAIWAGVEWLRNYKLAVALAAAAATVGGVTIAEQPHAPGADPPEQAISKPAKPRTSVPPSAPPRVAAPTPRRTSPPRPPVKVAPQVKAPPVTRATPTTPVRSRTQPQVTPSTTKPPVKPPKLPASKPTVIPPVKVTITPSLPPVVETPEACTINLLGLCVLG